MGTKIARLWLGPDLIIIPLEADYCTQILTNQLQKSTQYQLYDSLISDGFLFTQNIPHWRNMRKVRWSLTDDAGARWGELNLLRQERGIANPPLCPC